MNRINTINVNEIFEYALEVLQQEVRYRVGKDRGFTKYNIERLIRYIEAIEYRCMTHRPGFTISLQEVFDLIEGSFNRDKFTKEVFTILLNDVRDKIGVSDPGSIAMKLEHLKSIFREMLAFFSNKNNFMINVPKLPIIKGTEKDEEWDKRYKRHSQAQRKSFLLKRRIYVTKLATKLEIDLSLRRFWRDNIIHPNAAELILSLLKEKLRYFNGKETPPRLKREEVVELFELKDYDWHALSVFCGWMRVWLMGTMENSGLTYLEGEELVCIFRSIECGLLDIINS